METEPGRHREEVRVDPQEYTREPLYGRFYVRVVVSGLLLIAALYIILSETYRPDTTKWAFGTIGLVAGHWLPK